MARLGNKITVYGIEFKNLAEFSALLGYKANLSAAFVAKRYGTFEDMAKVRLRVNTDEQAKAKLLELMGQKDDKTIQKVSVLETKEQKCAKAYINALINQGNEQILDALCLAFDCKKDDVLQAVESLKNAQ